MSDTKLERILIIDDNSDYRNLIKTFISKLLPGVETIEYDPVFEGVPDDSFKWSDIDVLLLDYHLSIVGTTGLDILHQHHKKPSFPATIMLTGAGTEEIAIRALKSGIYEYQPKQSLTKDKLKQSIIHAWEDKKSARKKLQEITQHNRSFSKEVFYETLEQTIEQSDAARALVIIRPDNINVLEEQIGIIGRDNLVNHIAKNSFDVFKLGACNPNITRISDIEIGIQIDNPPKQETLEFNMEGLCKHLSKCAFKFSEEKYKYTISIGVLKIEGMKETAETLIHIASSACKIASDIEGNSFYIWKETDIVPEFPIADNKENLTKEKLDVSENLEKEKLEAELKAAAAAKEKAEADLRAAEEEKAKAEAEIRAEQEAREKAEAELRAAEEEKAKAQAEAELRAAEEEKAKAQAEAELRAAEEEKAKAQAEAELRAAEEEKAKAQAEAELRAAEEEKAKAQAEAEMKAAIEAKEKAEAELKAAAEAKAKAQAEAEMKAAIEAKEKAEAELKAVAKAKEKAEAEAKAAAEEKEKAEAEAKARAEKEAKEKAEAEAKARAEKEAKEKAEAEAKARAEKEAKAQAEAEMKAAIEAKEKLQAELKAVAEAKAQAEAEMKAAIEAKEKAEAELKAAAEVKSTVEKSPETSTSTQKELPESDKSKQPPLKEEENIAQDSTPESESEETATPQPSTEDSETLIKKLIDEKRIIQTYQPVIAMFDDETETKEIYRTGLQAIIEDEKINEDLSDTSKFSNSLQQIINEWILRQVFLRITESGTTKCGYQFLINVTESWFSDITLFNWLQKILSQTKKYNPGKSIILDVPINLYIKHQKRAQALINTLNKTHQFTVALSNIDAIDDMPESCKSTSSKLLILNIDQLKKLTESLSPDSQKESSEDEEETEKQNMLQYLKSNGIRIITTGIEDSTLLTDAITLGTDYTLGDFVGETQDNLVESTTLESFELT
jgi:CheY-like chemotaxis protein